MKILHKPYSYITLLLSIFSCQPCVANSGPKISVYTTDSYHITHPDLATKIYYLDKVVNFENLISQRLHKDPLLAEQQAKTIFDSPEWPTLETQLKDASEGIISGWQNGIKKIPAILFESSDTPPAVIYGETNVAKAIQQWQHWAKNEGKMQ